MNMLADSATEVLFMIMLNHANLNSVGHRLAYVLHGLRLHVHCQILCDSAEQGRVIYPWGVTFLQLLAQRT